MSYWNMRMVRHEHGVEIAEVYYNDAGEPRAYCSAEPIWYVDADDDSDPAASLSVQLQMMLDATAKPILDAASITERHDRP